jgi:peptidoglycan L-alanyl-D-glutamate endopeptidase CwlK
MADVNAKLKAASDKRLASLKPEFRAKVDKLLAAAEDATNLPWICVYGRRTLKEQAELYAQGRTKPGKVVTNAAPGFSAHNYGLAADLAPVKNGAICWDLPNFKKMADQAKKLGLVPGYYFNRSSMATMSRMRRGANAW